MLNHIHAEIFITTFLYAMFPNRKDRALGQFNSTIYIVDQVNILRNEGRQDAFTNFSFTIGANFRQDEQKFAQDIVDMLMTALLENFDDASAGIDWTDWTGHIKAYGKPEAGFPECRICVNVY